MGCANQQKNFRVWPPKVYYHDYCHSSSSLSGHLARCLKRSFYSKGVSLCNRSSWLLALESCICPVPCRTSCRQAGRSLARHTQSAGMPAAFMVLFTTVDSHYYELAYYEVSVHTRFFAGLELPYACFNALNIDYTSTVVVRTRL
jgi:hypothetical protein